MDDAITFSFDLSVENASTFLFKYARQITVNGGEKLNAEHNRALVKKAHELIDDSYKTCLCVEYPPQIIALALLHLATKFLQGYVRVQATATAVSCNPPPLSLSL